MAAIFVYLNSYVRVRAASVQVIDALVAAGADLSPSNHMREVSVFNIAGRGQGNEFSLSPLSILLKRGAESVQLSPINIENSSDIYDKNINAELIYQDENHLSTTSMSMLKDVVKYEESSLDDGQQLHYEKERSTGRRVWVTAAETLVRAGLSCFR